MCTVVHSFTEPETLASKGQNVGMMDKSVNECSGQATIAEYFVPLYEFEI